MTAISGNTALSFSGLPPDYSTDSLLAELRTYGHLQTVYISNNREYGYAIYLSPRSTQRASDNLNGKEWPPSTSHRLQASICPATEVDSLVRLANPQLRSVTLLEPESNARLFHATHTQPTLYYTVNP